MLADDRIFSLPRWRITRWLGDAGPDVPDDIRVALIGRLHGTLTVFWAGAANTITMAAVAAIWKPCFLFITWLVLELLICAGRLIVLMVADRAARARRKTPTDLHLLFAPWKRFRAALDAGTPPAAALQLNQIRILVAINLTLGIITIVVGATGRLW